MKPKRILRKISEKWYVDEYGGYYLHLGSGSFQYYGKPKKESEIIKKIENGELAFESTPISIIDGKKIYHVYNPNVQPRPHFDIVVE
jgi:hypothetical protein